MTIRRGLHGFVAELAVVPVPKTATESTRALIRLCTQAFLSLEPKAVWQLSGIFHAWKPAQKSPVPSVVLVSVATQGTLELSAFALVQAIKAGWKCSVCKVCDTSPLPCRGGEDQSEQLSVAV